MRKSRPLRRPTQVRSPKQKFILVTEGKNTEPDYFYALSRTLRGTLIEIQIIGAAGTPLTIAENACLLAKELRKRRKRRNSYEKNDEIWAVFDRDKHPYVDQAQQKCIAAGVGVAFSNPCFELWLILHFSDFDRPDDHNQVQKHFASICPDYDRNGRKTTDCAKLLPFVEEAEKRAEKQLFRRKEEGDPPNPPFTTMFRLIKEMRAASVRHKLD